MAGMSELNTTSKTVPSRAAFTLPEFAARFGKKRGWAYELAKNDRIRIIRGYGTLLVPASEVERILNGGQP